MTSEEAKELRHSILWPALVGELDRKVNFEMMKIKTCKPEELGIIQAKISCFEALTRLPDDVIDREEQ